MRILHEHRVNSLFPSQFLVSFPVSCYSLFSLKTVIWHSHQLPSDSETWDQSQLKEEESNQDIGCLKERQGCARQVLISSSLRQRASQRVSGSQQEPPPSPNPPLLACPQTFEWLVVKLDGDYWSARRAPAVSTKVWRLHQRGFFGCCLGSVAWRLREPLKRGLFEPKPGDHFVRITFKQSDPKKNFNRW